MDKPLFPDLFFNLYEREVHFRKIGDVSELNDYGIWNIKVTMYCELDKEVLSVYS